MAQPMSGRAMMIMSNLMMIGAAVTATTVAALGFRRLTTSSRRGAALLIGSMVSFAIGQTMYFSYELHPEHGQPFPAPADVAYVCSSLLLVAAIAILAPRQRRRLQTALDAAMIGCALLYVSWALVLGPIVRGGAGSAMEWTLLLLYPIVDLITGSIALLVVAQAGTQYRGPRLTIGLGALALAVGDSGFAYLAHLGLYVSGESVTDAGWVIGYLAMGWGVWYLAAMQERPAGQARARSVASDAGAATVPTRATVVGVTTPYLPFAAALVTTVFLVARDGSVPKELLLLGLGFALLVMVRQVVALWDNILLAGKLRSTVERLQLREQELEMLAFHDSLTGLANRTLFHDRARHALIRQDRLKTSLSVLYIDLDGFKAVNDRLGHAAGDALLVTVAERLRSCVRASDTLARLGGDEFAVLADPMQAVEDVAVIAERIVRCLAAPVSLSNGTAMVTASVGIATREPFSGDLDALLRRADEAMYQAKGGGKNQVVQAR
ncbi:putative signaling protein [Actinoplanes sp. SE50]|nr:putative signaling protein [Actinoplanes sp. SE50/110]ATO83464.1 putative signaling protein [Actinoplanes sp. SE50]SLM00871.1 hypothetical protein ACSP50_4104 [Actinoplanes sp. SE50/110]